MMSRADREAAAARAGKPTKKQIEFLEILFNDCGFTTRLVRNDYLSRRLGRRIGYLDELTFLEVKDLIPELKQRRDEANEHRYRSQSEEEET